LHIRGVREEKGETQSTKSSKERKGEELFLGTKE